MKRAFTFAELMICLLVISVVTAVLYPTIAQFNPNTNKPLFKSAYKTLTTALNSITSERLDNELPICSGIFNKPDCSTTNSGKLLCQAFCEKVNVIVGATARTCEQSCTNNELQTTNGMRWKFSNYTTVADVDASGNAINERTVFVVFVDVNSSNNDTTPAIEPQAAGTTISFNNGTSSSTNGVFFYTDEKVANQPQSVYRAAPSTTSSGFDFERLKNQDTFRIEINKFGKITDMSDAGWANLEDTIAPD